MSGPTTVNPIATEADTIIKDLEAVAVPLIEAAIQAEVPALALPVVKQLSNEIIQIIANQLSKYIETGATDVITDLQSDSEQNSISNDIFAIESDEKSGNTAQLTKDEAQYGKDQSALVNDNGSAVPK